MRWLVLLIGLPVATGLMLVSMIANWRFGVRLGAEDGDAWAYGLASVCADGLKVILPFAIGWAWSRRRAAEWLSAACLWLVITAYSLVSALSFAAVNRAEITDRKLAQSRQHADLRIDLEARKAERSQLPPTRPAIAVEADLSATEQNSRWQTTRQCAEVETRVARSFCQRYLRLKAELGVSNRAAKLDADIRDISTRIASLPATAASRNVDPQVDLFRDLSGLSENRIRSALAVLVCLLIELGSGLGLFVVMSCYRATGAVGETGAGHAIIPSPIELVPTSTGHEDWAEQRLQRDNKSMTGAAELYADYRLWTEARGRTSAMTATAFGRWMTDLGLERDREGGRIIYRGIRLIAMPPSPARS